MITTPLPTFAPKSRNSIGFGERNGNSGLMKNKAFTKYQSVRLMIPAPKGKSELSKRLRSTVGRTSVMVKAT